MSTALSSHQFHQRIAELNREGWVVAFGLRWSCYFECALLRDKTRVVGYGGNPLSALYDAEANLKEPVSKSVRDQLRRASH